MATYETALFLTFGVVSGICPFIVSAYRGGGRTVILLVIAGPLAAQGYRWLAGSVPLRRTGAADCGPVQN